MRHSIFLITFLISATATLLARSVQPTPQDTKVRAIVQVWSHAHAARDLAALSAIYAPEVRVNGLTMSKDVCLSMKNKFFQDNPTFTQSILGDIKISQNDKSKGYTARFSKQVLINGTKQTIPSYLIIDELGPEDNKLEKAWKVIVESDEVTDANLLKQKRSFDPAKFRTCEDAVTAIFKSSKSIRKLITAPIILEIEETKGAGIYTLHLFYLPPLSGHTLTMGWYDFNTKTGVLMDFILDEKLGYDRSLLSQVATFCK
jgi:ketosteroid isomerase-like protein